jgi:hypothetical protein
VSLLCYGKGRRHVCGRKRNVSNGLRNKEVNIVLHWHVLRMIERVGLGKELERYYDLNSANDVLLAR